MYLPTKASRARVREAENARRNRAEILKAWSQGQVSRRDLIKMGFFTAGGALTFKNGLSPFAPSAYAAIPTGLPRSPLFGVQAFTQPMPRFDVLPRNPVSALNPAPLAQVDETKRHLLDPRLEGVRPGDTGPNEGRPPGPIWAHQEFTRFAPKISIEATQEGAKANTLYNPGVTSNFNSGINAAASFRPTFHPGLPDQGPLALWTFNGTLPPKRQPVAEPGGGDPAGPAGHRRALRRCHRLLPLQDRRQSLDGKPARAPGRHEAQTHRLAGCGARGHLARSVRR